jgi:hypothetical protein
LISEIKQRNVNGDQFQVKSVQHSDLIFYPTPSGPVEEIFLLRLGRENEFHVSKWNGIRAWGRSGEVGTAFAWGISEVFSVHFEVLVCAMVDT